MSIKLTMVQVAHLLLAIVLLSSTTFASLSQAATSSNKILRGHDDLTPNNGEYTVSWLADLEEDKITFEVIVRTKGWVGFGLSHTGGMKGADIVIGYVRGNGGVPYFSDRHANEATLPLEDSLQNWFLVNAWENQTHTSLEFSRSLKTCDEEEDIEITENSINIIWSYGEIDEIDYHGPSRRGTRQVYLLDPPMPDPDLSQYKTWVIQANDNIPNVTTSYYCTIHKRPQMDRVHHVIGFDTRFDTPEAVKHTHHFILRKCIPPKGVDPREMFEPHVNQPGEDCASKGILRNFCATYLFVWAVGGRKTIFPDHVGHPIGEGGGDDEYFMLEIHYDNPEEKGDLHFPTGLEVYYTDNLRPNEVGIMTLGHIVYWAQTVPPNEEEFTIYGHCSPVCTRTFPSGGLNVFNVLLHSHVSGRKLKLQHFRNRTELPWFAYDDQYDFNYQQNRPLREEKKILPGDNLIMNCVYDTTWKNGSIVIGDLGITDEMCEAMIFYYPRILMDTCMSSYNPLKLQKDFGIVAMTSAGPGQMDPQIVLPANISGLRYTDYLNHHFNWTEEFKKEYKEGMKTSHHFQLCASLANFTFIPKGWMVKYPTEIEPYVPEPKLCRPDQDETTTIATHQTSVSTTATHQTSVSTPATTTAVATLTHGSLISTACWIVLILSLNYFKM